MWQESKAALDWISCPCHQASMQDELDTAMKLMQQSQA